MYADRSEVSRQDHEFQCPGCDAWFPHEHAVLDCDGEAWCEDCWGDEIDVESDVLDEREPDHG